jgi:large subunit GTPase 1
LETGSCRVSRTLVAPELAGSTDHGLDIFRLAEGEKLLLTPYERNIQVWRQLWRVIERSHLIVQIVDARNPLTFRCKDLEDYVSEVGVGPSAVIDEETGEMIPKQEKKGIRRSLLLINKSDLLTRSQR